MFNQALRVRVGGLSREDAADLPAAYMVAMLAFIHASVASQLEALSPVAGGSVNCKGTEEGLGGDMVVIIYESL